VTKWAGLVICSSTWILETLIYPTSLQQYKVFSYGITLGTRMGRSTQWGWDNGKCEGQTNGTRTIGRCGAFTGHNNGTYVGRNNTICTGSNNRICAGCSNTICRGRNNTMCVGRNNGTCKGRNNKICIGRNNGTCKGLNN
jgi:hypothetical protein